MKNSFKLLAFSLIITLATCSNGMSRLLRFAPAAKAAINNSRLFGRSAFARIDNSIKSSSLFKKFATSAQPVAFGMPSRTLAQRVLIGSIGTGSLATAAVNTASSEQVTTKKEPLTQNEIDILTAAADLRVIDTEIAALKKAILRERNHQDAMEYGRTRACEKLKSIGSSEEIQSAVWWYFEYTHNPLYTSKLGDELHIKETQKKAYLLTLTSKIANKAEQLNSEYFKALHILPQEKQILEDLYKDLQFINEMNGMRVAAAKVDQHFCETSKAADDKDKAHQEELDELNAEIQAQCLKIKDLESKLRLEYKA